MSKWTPIAQAKLPEPLPQSYLGKKRYILQNRDKITIIEDNRKEDTNHGVRYYVNQDEIDKIFGEKFK